MAFVDQYRDRFDKAIDHLKHELTSLRTGRATPALVEDVPVLAYDTKQQLKAVASISVADAKTIVVEPWDKSLMQAVESAIRNADLGINPVNDGQVIRLPLPDLTSERRQELIKVLNKKLEEARIAVRKIREDIRDEIEKSTKEKQISEDEKFTYMDEVERAIKELNETIRTVGVEKEQEILKV